MLKINDPPKLTNAQAHYVRRLEETGRALDRREHGQFPQIATA